MESLAKFFGHDFKDGDFRLFDRNGNEKYIEEPDGYWAEREYDKNGNEKYFKDSGDYWVKKECDKEGKIIYFEDASGIGTNNRSKAEPKITIEGKIYKLVEVKGD